MVVPGDAAKGMSRRTPLELRRTPLELVECEGWGLAVMGATAMGATALGLVGGGVSTRRGVTAIERDGRGLAEMAETTMGRVGGGASARWGATAIVGLRSLVRQ